MTKNILYACRIAILQVLKTIVKRRILTYSYKEYISAPEARVLSKKFEVF